MVFLLFTLKFMEVILPHPVYTYIFLCITEISVTKHKYMSLKFISHSCAI